MQTSENQRNMKWIEDGAADKSFYCGEGANIFLIGDSIRKGYCATVRERLSDVARVFYVDDNCRSSQNIIFSMKNWAGRFDDCSKVDIIQFNCGHWDVAHWNGYELSLTSEAEYEKNIRMIILLLRKFFPNARLVFATTTPMNPNGGVGTNPRSNEEIDRYNSIAQRVATELSVDIADLNSATRQWGSECYRDYCHFTPESFERLGESVAEYLRKMI